MFILAQDVDADRYDAIIAGSGPAGAMVAKRMAGLGKTVLVVESGNREFNNGIQNSYSVVHGQGNFDSSYWPNHWIRALGGTSAVWAGWVSSLSARNMAKWPISRADLDLWYDIAAQELGRPKMISRWSAPAFEGFTLRPFSRGITNRYGEEAGEQIWGNDNVHVLLNTSITKLTPSPDRRRLGAVTLFGHEGGERELSLRPRQPVVLAAGGMGNAQILLASDNGESAAVGNENDQVGRYLMEHPHFYNCALLVMRQGFDLASIPEEFGNAIQAIVPDNVVYEAMGGLDASFELKEATLDSEDAAERFIVDRLGGRAKAFAINARTEMAADPENRVERISGADPAGLPRLRATCIFNSDDYRSVLGYLRSLGQAVAQSEMGRLQIRNDALFWGVTGGGHTMGTTRMGSSPATSVTDADCRVHGYENLFIAGSSLFPTGGHSNPTLTIIALAARLGDYLGKGT